MCRKYCILILSICFLSSSIPLELVYAASPASEYICELGVAFYKLGKYDDALAEFNKVLMLNPTDPVAKQYISNIFQKENPAQNIIPRKDNSIQRPATLPQVRPTRDAIMSSALAQANKRPVPEEKEPKKVKFPVELSGEVRVGMGATPDAFIWKDANADRVGVPREKNWRYLWGDQRENTYDPKIYDRLSVNLDTNFDSPLNGFMQVTADPWTFTGKNHVTVNNTATSDFVNMDVKYWSADGRTINETYRSNKGQIIRLDQIKVVDGKTTDVRLKTAPTSAAFGSTIDHFDIKREYRPVRKLWFDYVSGDATVKFFPISDEFEAFTSDDPLRISNNHVYWEESPWLDQYEQSRDFQSAGTPVKKGRWIRSLSSFTKDSSDDYPHRLTFLRGMSFNINPGDYSLEGAVATPMTLWDDYQSAKSIEGSARLKVPIEDLTVGLTSATKVGMRGNTREALNQAQALDLKYNLLEYWHLFGEIAQSFTEVDEVNGYKNKYNGFGAKLGFDYDESEYKTDGIYRGGVYGAYMESSFYPGLSNYRYTRRDEPTWSRHVYFAKIKDEDRNTIWGDGMDRGRQVLGGTLGLKALDEQLDEDLMYRTIRSSKGKYVESVLRTETTYKHNDRLTSRVLGYYQNLPHTKGGFDPLIYAKTMYSLTDYFSDDDEHPINASVVDGKDPSVGAFGYGIKYDVVETKVSLEGMYERTNDPLDFPRGLLNDLSFGTEVKDDNQIWDKLNPFLYDQGFFNSPPYEYYNIAKTRLIVTPSEQWEIILRYTFNENKHATGIDDNINHAGFETTYKPSEKLTLWTKFMYTRLIDLYKQNKFQSSDFFDKHFNFFFGTEYRLSKDESFTVLYGEFVGYNDPYQQANWTLSALDTQHIFRLFYKRKF